MNWYFHPFEKKKIILRPAGTTDNTELYALHKYEINKYRCTVVLDWKQKKNTDFYSENI